MKQADLGLNLSIRRGGLDKMNSVESWTELVGLIAPCPPEGWCGHRPVAVESMPRIHFMPQCFGPRYPAMEAALHEMPMYREFAGLVHTVEGSSVTVNDVVEANALLHGEEPSGLGDAIFKDRHKRPEAKALVRPYQGTLLRDGEEHHAIGHAARAGQSVARAVKIGEGAGRVRPQRQKSVHHGAPTGVAIVRGAVRRWPDHE